MKKEDFISRYRVEMATVHVSPQLKRKTLDALEGKEKPAMIAILKPNVPQEQIDNLIRWLESQGLKIHISAGDYYTVLG